MAHGSLHAVAASSWFVTSKTPLAILDSQARFEGANPAYLKATARGIDQLLGSVVFDVFPDNPDDPDADGVRNLSASLQRVMRSGRPHDMVFQRYDIPRADDQTRFAYKVWSPANAPIQDDEGRVVGVLHRVEDITSIAEFLGDPRTDPRELDAGGALRAYARAIAQLKATNADLRGQNKLLLNALLATGESRMTVSTKNARRGWIRQRLADSTSQLGPASAVCAVAVEMLGVDGAVLTLRVAPGCPFVVGASSTWARVVKELAYTTGEGPGDTAVSTGAPVLVSDLTAETYRWPGFASAALDLGVRAGFAFPLRVGGEALGALVLYRKHAGVLSASEFVAAGLLVDVAQGTLIELVHKAISDPDNVLGLEDPGRARWAVIHLAAGMIAAQLRSTTDEATSRLRAHAFAESRSIVEVAQDVIDRRLRFD